MLLQMYLTFKNSRPQVTKSQSLTTPQQVLQPQRGHLQALRENREKEGRVTSTSKV